MNNLLVSQTSVSGTRTRRNRASLFPQPVLLTLTASTTTSVSLSWNAAIAPVGVPVTNYVISNGNTQTTLASNITSYTYSGLTSGTSYSFHVEAINAVGTAPQSNTVTATTGGTVNATVPTMGTLSLGAVTSTSITVNWTAGTAPASDPITEYRVYRAGNVATHSPTVRTHTSNNLTPGTSNSFQVSAVNNAGESVKSNTITATTTSVSNGSRFPGDPGVGKYYFGGRENDTDWPVAGRTRASALADWESKMSPYNGGQHMGIRRLYDSGSLTSGFTGDSSLITATYAAGMLPHVSFKFPSQFGTTVATQSAKAMLFDADWDTWMNAIATKMKSYAPKPIWWTFFHEPEDFNTAALQANYRAICRRMAQDLKALGVTNAAFVSGCITAPADMGGAYSTNDWRNYYPDWKGTSTGGATRENADPLGTQVDFYTGSQSVVDIFGVDVYSWWNAARYPGEDEDNYPYTKYPTGTAAEPQSKYYTFATLWSKIGNQCDFLGKPYCMGEYGVEAYHTGTYVPSIHPSDYYNPTGATDTSVFGTTNNNLTAANIQGMFDNMPSFNIVACEVYNYALTHKPWILDYADPQLIRYREYGYGQARPECVIPSEAGWTMS